MRICIFMTWLSHKVSQSASMVSFPTFTTEIVGLNRYITSFVSRLQWYLYSGTECYSQNIFLVTICYADLRDSLRKFSIHSFLVLPVSLFNSSSITFPWFSGRIEEARPLTARYLKRSENLGDICCGGREWAGVHVVTRDDVDGARMRETWRELTCFLRIY